MISVYTVEPTQLSLQELVCVLDANSWHTWWKNCFWQIDHRPLIKLDKWCIKRLLQIPDQKHPCFDNRNRVLENNKVSIDIWLDYSAKNDYCNFK